MDDFKLQTKNHVTKVADFEMRVRNFEGQNKAFEQKQKEEESRRIRNELDELQKRFATVIVSCPFSHLICWTFSFLENLTCSDLNISEIRTFGLHYFWERANPAIENEGLGGVRKGIRWAEILHDEFRKIESRTSRDIASERVADSRLWRYTRLPPPCFSRF